MQTYNLLCSHNFNNLLKKLDSYSIDLGRSYSKRDEITKVLQVNIKDLFVTKFFKDTGLLIYKVGILGAINIYTFSNLKANEVIIFKNDEYYQKEFDLNEAEYDIEGVLAKIIFEDSE